METAIVLAAGRGTRMQRGQVAAKLTLSQAAVAQSGLKAMMPVGRPFIDYVLSGLADAGYLRICLVIGPQHGSLRAHVSRYKSRRIEIAFRIQPEPLGTASALVAARDFVENEHFLLINSDNYYPRPALEGVGKAIGPAVAGFKTQGLLRGNISADRLRNFAVLSADSKGMLRGIVEKPTSDVFMPGGDPLIGMNCWRFTPKIFEACSAIGPSPRGEVELTDAVAYAIDTLDERFQVLIVDEPVLDLSTPADIEEVSRQLASIEVRL